MSRPIVASGSQVGLILIGAALLLMLGMGIRQSFGLFVTPVTHDLAITAADFTLALAIQNIVWGLSQAVVGAIADRFGLRITMIAGAAIYIIGLGIMAAAQGVPALIISNGLIGVSGDGYRLTEAGTKEARQVLRAHRLWESYLESIGTPQEALHSTAHRMEHMRAGGTVDYLDEKLGQPALDPHGHTIPRQENNSKQT